MVYKALLVGINYYMQKEDSLQSPLENIELFKDFLISYAHFKPDNIISLSDNPEYTNATFSITTELKNMIETVIEMILFLFTFVVMVIFR